MDSFSTHINMSLFTILISSIMLMIGHSMVIPRERITVCTPENRIINITGKCSDRLIIENAEIEIGFYQSHQIHQGKDNSLTVFNPGVKANLTGDISWERRKEKQTVKYKLISYYFDLHGFGNITKSDEVNPLRFVLIADNVEQDGFEFSTEIKHFLRKEIASCLVREFKSYENLSKNSRPSRGNSCPAPEVPLKHQVSRFSFQTLVNKFTDIAIGKNLRDIWLVNNVLSAPSAKIPWFENTIIHGNNVKITGLSKPRRSGDVIVSRKKKSYSFLLKVQFDDISVSLENFKLKKGNQDIFTTKRATLNIGKIVDLEAIVRFKLNDYPCGMKIHKLRVSSSGKIAISDVSDNSKIPRQKEKEKNDGVLEGISNLLKDSLQQVNCKNFRLLNFLKD